MNITVNGEEKSYDSEMTVSELLKDLEIPKVGIAVEINKEIIPRGTHDSVKVGDGDIIEIVRMVGGGCF